MAQVGQASLELLYNYINTLCNNKLGVDIGSQACKDFFINNYGVSSWSYDNIASLIDNVSTWTLDNILRAWSDNQSSLNIYYNYNTRDILTQHDINNLGSGTQQDIIVNVETGKGIYQEVLNNDFIKEFVYWDIGIFSFFTFVIFLYGFFKRLGKRFY